MHDTPLYESAHENSLSQIKGRVVPGIKKPKKQVIKYMEILLIFLVSRGISKAKRAETYVVKYVNI